MKNKRHQKEEAMNKVKELFKEAELMFKRDPSLSDRYVQLARKIAMRYTLIIPKELKRKFCKHCHSYLVPGRNCRVRIQKSRVIYYCERCKKFMRFGLK